MWSIVNDFRIGSINNRDMIIGARENPGGLHLTLLCRATFVAFVAAVILNASDPIGDAFAWFARSVPFQVHSQQNHRAV
jgi:hypothetical protein